MPPVLLTLPLCAVPLAGDCEGLGVGAHRGELGLRSHSTPGLSLRVPSPLLSPSRTSWQPDHPALRTCQLQLDLHLSTPNRSWKTLPTVLPSITTRLDGCSRNSLPPASCPSIHSTRLLWVCQQSFKLAAGAITWVMGPQRTERTGAICAQ